MNGEEIWKEYAAVVAARKEYPILIANRLYHHLENTFSDLSHKKNKLNEEEDSMVHLESDHLSNLSCRNFEQYEKDTDEILRRFRELQEAAAFKKKIDLNETNAVLFGKRVKLETSSDFPMKYTPDNSTFTIEVTNPNTENIDDLVENVTMQNTSEMKNKTVARLHHSMIVSLENENESTTPRRARRSSRNNTIF